MTPRRWNVAECLGIRMGEAYLNEHNTLVDAYEQAQVEWPDPITGEPLRIPALYTQSNLRGAEVTRLTRENAELREKVERLAFTNDELQDEVVSLSGPDIDLVRTQQERDRLTHENAELRDCIVRDQAKSNALRRDFTARAQAQQDERKDHLKAEGTLKAHVVRLRDALRVVWSELGIRVERGEVSLQGLLQECDEALTSTPEEAVSITDGPAS